MLATHSGRITAHPEADPLPFCHLGRRGAFGNNRQRKRVFQAAFRSISSRHPTPQFTGMM
jgi:hypothetical protein